MELIIIIYVVDCHVILLISPPTLHFMASQLKCLLRQSIQNSLKLVTRPSPSALTTDYSRRSLTMMSMLCWRRACQSQKRCVRQRTNMAGTVIIRQMVKEVFSPWWPKLRQSWRVSGGSVCFRVWYYQGTFHWMWCRYYEAHYYDILDGIVCLMLQFCALLI